METRERADKGYFPILFEALQDLEASIHYKHICDEAYFAADEDKKATTIEEDPVLIQHARLYVAGMIARNETDPRKRSRQGHLEHALAVRSGAQETPDSLVEKLP